jgi:hypothetical protein
MPNAEINPNVEVGTSAARRIEGSADYLRFGIRSSLIIRHSSF